MRGWKGFYLFFFSPPSRCAWGSLCLTFQAGRYPCAMYDMLSVGFGSFVCMARGVSGCGSGYEIRLIDQLMEATG